MYQWNLNELKKKRLQLLKELICNIKLQLNDRMKIKSDLNLITDMINEFEVDKTFTLFPNQNLTFIDEKQLFPKMYYEAFLKLSPNILSILFPIIREYDQIDINDNEYLYFNLDEKEIINSTRDFYQSLPNKKYYNEIEKYLNPSNHLLQFIYGNIYAPTTGETFYFETQNTISYVLVRIINEIHDLLTLDHELAHVYYNQYNNLDNYLTPYYYLIETEGLFFEYLKEEFLLTNNIPKEDIYKKRIEHFNNIIELIINLYVGKVTTNQFSKTKNINEESILQIIYQNGISTEYNSNLIYESIHNYPRSNIKECIAYLTFLDLKNIANHDLEESLYLLENIRKDKNPNIISTLRKNKITFMDDNYENLNKEYQKLKEYRL